MHPQVAEDAQGGARDRSAARLKRYPTWRLAMVAACVFGALFGGVAARAQCQTGWLPGDGYSGVNGTVYATMVWDPDGDGPMGERLVIAGTFSIAGNQFVNNIAMWDGELNGGWTALGTGISGVSVPQQIGPVMALAVYNGELVVGGKFTGAGGAVVNNIARWDGVSWRPLGAGLTGVPSNLPAVTSLTIYRGELVACGAFTTAGGHPADGIARWDGTTWRPLGAGFWVEGEWPTTMMTMGDDLLVGGSFTQAGAVSADRLAFWNGEAWRPHPGQLPVEDFAWPSAITTCNGTLVVAVTDFVGYANSYILQWNGTSWEVLGNNQNQFQNVYTGVFAMREYRGQLLIAGYHLAFMPGPGGGSYYRVADVLRRDATLVPAWRRVNSGTGDVQSLQEFDGRLVAGGNFGGLGAGSAAGIAWAEEVPVEGGGSWRSIGFEQDPLIQTQYMLPFRGSLVQAGAVSYGSPPVSRPNPIQMWDGVRRTVIGDMRTLFGNPMPPPPYYAAAHALQEFEGDLVVAGWFTSIDGVPLTNIARWGGPDTGGWGALGEGLPDADVNCLAVHDGSLYAGLSSGQVKKWNGATWELLPPPVGTPYAMASFNGQLHVGMYGAVRRLAGGSWESLPQFAFPAVATLLFEYRGELIVGGLRVYAGGSSTNRIAGWNGTSWRALGAGLTGNSSSTYGITAMAEYNGDLFVAGDFASAGGAPARGVARWSPANGGRWSSLSGGTSDLVHSLGRLGGDLVACGAFVSAGNQVSYNVARWSDSGLPWLAGQPQPVSAPCHAEHAGFSVVVPSGFPLVWYSWRRDGVALQDGATGSGSTIAGSQTATLTIGRPGPLDRGVYTCVVANGCGTTLSNSAMLTIQTACSADLDCSGAAEPADLSLFVNRWLAGFVSGALDADFNGDLVVTPADLAGFVNAWLGAVQNGCG